MDGLLVIDKPSGPTSHDVVARMRRVLRERRIGHTGTLDPLATGVLPLVIGRATRLARFLAAADKTYEATVRLGYATDTDDAEGAIVGARYDGPLPTIEVIDRALEELRGQRWQQPPAFSAKRVAGRRSHETARAARRRRLNADPIAAPDPSGSAALPNVTSVTARRIDVVRVDADLVTIYLECSAGFYVRALAHDLGVRLGVGAHLAALRRTRSGDLTLEQAVALDAAERDPAGAAAGIVPLGRMLPQLPSVTLDAFAVMRTVQGRDLESGLLKTESGLVRLIDAAGELVAIAGPSPERPGLLHPFVVLR